MKLKNFSRRRDPKTAGAMVSAAAAESSWNEIEFAPLPDEVARRAYFSYVNQGSLPGNAVQHWLTAEAQLLAERRLTRIHGFHNPT